LGREACALAKSTDAQAKCVGPGAVGGGDNLNWLNAFLKAGAADYLDVVSHHFYVSYTKPEEVLHLIHQVRSVMARHGIAHKAVWSTEAGWWIENEDGTPPKGVVQGWKKLNSDEAAAFVARALMLGWAAGLERYYWYAWDNHGLGLIEPTSQQMKPAGVAYGRMADWMIGKVVRSCARAGQVWSCKLAELGGNVTWVVWSADGPDVWTIPSGWRVERIEALDGSVSHAPDATHVTVAAKPVRVFARGAP
jgi:hypothetical protein